MWLRASCPIYASFLLCKMGIIIVLTSWMSELNVFIHVGLKELPAHSAFRMFPSVIVSILNGSVGVME